MKNIITRIEQYADEPKVSLYVHSEKEYNHITFYLKDKSLEEDRLVLIKNVEKFKKQKENMIYYLEKEDWTKPCLDDFMLLENEVPYDLFRKKDFSSKEYLEFKAKIMPSFIEKLDKYLSNFEIGEERLILNRGMTKKNLSLLNSILLRLSKTKPETQKWYYTMDALDLTKKANIKNESEAKEISKNIALLQRMAKALGAIIELTAQDCAQETERFYFEKEKPFVKQAAIESPDKIIELIKECKSYEIKSRLQNIFLGKITDSNNRVPAKHLETLKEFSKHYSDAVNNSNIRWILPSNAKGQKINIEKARVERSAYFSNLVDAIRVGNISNSEHVLIVRPSKSGKKTVYVKGDKKLKTQVKNAGGMLEKYGNTLMVNEGLPKKLMEIEKINVLAALNPKKVIDLLKSKKIETKKLELLLPKIAVDYKESRKLADITVELLYNIDPKAAKKLIKEFGL